MSKIDDLINKLCPNGVEFKSLDKISSITTGKLNANAMVEDGEYAFFTCDAKPFRIDKYAFDGEAILISGNGSQVGHLNYYIGKFNAYQRTYVLMSFIDSIIPKYLYHYLNTYLKGHIDENSKKGSIPYITLPMLQGFNVPIPPLEVQNEIVRILDKFGELEAELEAELEVRKSQYEFWRGKLLNKEYGNKKKIYEVTIWDKKFNSVEKNMQSNTIKYPVLLASDLFLLDKPNGNVFLLSTGEQTGWTTEELAGENLCEGEVVTIPWGKSRPVSEVMKYYNGKFVTGDNRIATSNDNDLLLNKYLYYWFQNNGNEIDTFYRGAGIQHPNMKKILTMTIDIPPLEIQKNIVNMLDKFESLVNDITLGLPAEIELRRQQYEYYRNKLLSFEELSIN